MKIANINKAYLGADLIKRIGNQYVYMDNGEPPAPVINMISGTVVNGTSSVRLRINEHDFLDIEANNGEFYADYDGNITRLDLFTNNQTSIITISLIGLNVSNVWSMYRMFYRLPNLVEVNAVNFTTTSALTNVTSLFEGCSSLTSVPEAFKNIDCSNVTDIQTVFKNCTSLVNADLSGWTNVNKGQNLFNFFKDCRALETINISGWDTSNMQLPNTRTPPTTGCTGLRNITMNNTNNGTLLYWQTSLVNSGIATHVTITRDGYNWTYSGGTWSSTPITT